LKDHIKAATAHEVVSVTISYILLTILTSRY